MEYYFDNLYSITPWFIQRRLCFYNSYTVTLVTQAVFRIQFIGKICCNKKSRLNCF